MATVLSVFSGVGGLDLGLERAGFRAIACAEKWEIARRSLSANWPNRLLLTPGDVSSLGSSLTPGDLGIVTGALDLIAAGPPCQPFSKAAQWRTRSRTGLDDPRARPLQGLLDLIERFLPRAVLLENVPGFVRGRTDATGFLANGLGQINRNQGTHYGIQTKVLDASHFGVPQARRRAIMIATRDGQPFHWPQSTHAGRPITAWEAIGDLSDTESPQSSGRWADLLPSIPEGENYLWHTARGGGLPLFGYRTRYWSFLLKLDKHRPSWTLPASPGPSTGPFHWNSRPLSIREMLRLQSFPATWRVVGSRRDAVRQVGNATPPLLVETIARALLSLLGYEPARRRRTLLRRRYTGEPPPSVVRSVQDKFKHLQGRHAPHPGPGQGPNPRIEMRYDA